MRAKGASWAGPSINGMPPEAFKAMDKDCGRYVFDFINGFWNDRAYFESWHKNQCVPVTKSGDLSDPKKWQEVMLMDVMSKIFSCVINVQCLDILDAHGKKLKFGENPKICCRYGLFTIETLLNIQKNHNLPTFVGFFDPFKAFNTTGHDLLTKVLKIYGSPPILSWLSIECI